MIKRDQTEWTENPVPTWEGEPSFERASVGID